VTKLNFVLFKTTLAKFPCLEIYFHKLINLQFTHKKINDFLLKSISKIVRKQTLKDRKWRIPLWLYTLCRMLFTT